MYLTQAGCNSNVNIASNYTLVPNHTTRYLVYFPLRSPLKGMRLVLFFGFELATLRLQVKFRNEGTPVPLIHDLKHASAPNSTCSFV